MQTKSGLQSGAKHTLVIKDVLSVYGRAQKAQGRQEERRRRRRACERGQKRKGEKISRVLVGRAHFRQIKCLQGLVAEGLGPSPIHFRGQESKILNGEVIIRKFTTAYPDRQDQRSSIPIEFQQDLAVASRLRSIHSVHFLGFRLIQFLAKEHVKRIVNKDSLTTLVIEMAGHGLFKRTMEQLLQLVLLILQNANKQSIQKLVVHIPGIESTGIIDRIVDAINKFDGLKILKININRAKNVTIEQYKSVLNLCNANSVSLQLARYDREVKLQHVDALFKQLTLLQSSSLNDLQINISGWGFFLNQQLTPQMLQKLGKFLAKSESASGFNLKLVLQDWNTQMKVKEIKEREMSKMLMVSERASLRKSRANKGSTFNHCKYEIIV